MVFYLLLEYFKSIPQFNAKKLKCTNVINHKH
jgi:hypothetical protein